ncbi:MAG: hypothetical protein Q6356_004250 [Candidatus Wukongarchaeota archaeon]|nr:hypothetical protein [Candidatus Wukongarchaeota archaeon]
MEEKRWLHVSEKRLGNREATEPTVMAELAAVIEKAGREGEWEIQAGKDITG